MKTYSPNLSLFLEQPHQHSSLPPVVIPHLGWDWRVLRLLLSVNIGTSGKMNTCRNRCVQKAMKALPRINIGLVKILIIFKSYLKKQYDDWQVKVWSYRVSQKNSALACFHSRANALFLLGCPVQYERSQFTAAVSKIAVWCNLWWYNHQCTLGLKGGPWVGPI